LVIISSDPDDRLLSRQTGFCKDPLMDEAAERRVGRNESLMRQVNEAIEQGRWPEQRDTPVRFRCECAKLDCNEGVELTIPEYESVREHPRRFAVHPGHQAPDVETIVEMSSRYLVVEKVGDAGELAEGLDPRS
jgi:hypothetical protein